MTGANPFHYQGPVTTTNLIDRRAELHALQRAAANRVAIRLAAPRRFGKTSLVEAHLAAMRDVGHRAVRVDLSTVGTVADVAARVAAGYASLTREPVTAVARWADRLGVELSAGPAKLRVGPATRRLGADDARVALLQLLEVPATLHAGDGDLTVVCFDEFQDLLVADDRLDGLFRSVIQHHGDAAAYVFAGSQPSLMRALFSEYERPFYGQARPVDVPELPVEEATEDIERLLRDARLDPGDAVVRVLAFTGGHPQRTMLLAHHLFERLDAGSRDPAADALSDALSETRDAHQATWDGLSRVERIVAVGLADGVAPTSEALASEHRVARSTLQSAVGRMLASAQHVVRTESGHAELLDPLLREWLRRR